MTDNPDVYLTNGDDADAGCVVYLDAAKTQPAARVFLRPIVLAIVAKDEGEADDAVSGLLSDHPARCGLAGEPWNGFDWSYASNFKDRFDYGAVVYVPLPEGRKPGDSAAFWEVLADFNFARFCAPACSGDLMDMGVKDESKPFTLPPITVRMDEEQYRTAISLIHAAAWMVGDGMGNELGCNPEYERGQAELICQRMGWSRERKHEVIEAIHKTARALTAR